MIRRPPRSTRTDTLFPTRRSSDLHRHWPVLADKLSLQREIDGAAIDGIWIVAQQRIIWTVEPGAVSWRPLFAVIFLAVAGIVFIQKVIQAISLIEAQFIETFEQSLISTRSEIGRASCRERVCQ